MNANLLPIRTVPSESRAHCRRPSAAPAALLLAALSWTAALTPEPARAANPAAPAPHEATPGEGLARDDLVAALILKVLPFVDWPADAPPAPPRTIVVVGPTPYLATLRALASRARTAEAGVVVQQVEDVRELPPCHVLVFPPDRVADLALVPPERRRGLLTLGQHPGFTRSGGVMSIVPAEKGLTLTVNTRNARTARLEVESRLLRIAEVER